MLNRSAGPGINGLERLTPRSRAFDGGRSNRTASRGTDDAAGKVSDADDRPIELYAAFIIENWDWVIGFDGVGIEGYDYVSIPADRVVGVMSAQYAQFSANGRRVTGYGITDAEIREFRDLLPL